MVANKKTLPFGTLVPDIDLQRFLKTPVQQIIDAYTTKHPNREKFAITDFRVATNYASMVIHKDGKGYKVIYKKMHKDSVEFETVASSWEYK